MKQIEKRDVMIGEKETEIYDLKKDNQVARRAAPAGAQSCSRRAPSPSFAKRAIGRL